MRAEPDEYQRRDPRSQVPVGSAVDDWNRLGDATGRVVREGIAISSEPTRQSTSPGMVYQPQIPPVGRRIRECRGGWRTIRTWPGPGGDRTRHTEPSNGEIPTEGGEQPGDKPQRRPDRRSSSATTGQLFITQTCIRDIESIHSSCRWPAIEFVNRRRAGFEPLASRRERQRPTNGESAKCRTLMELGHQTVGRRHGGVDGHGRRN